jgi:hypothetical protein
MDSNRLQINQPLYIHTLCNLDEEWDGEIGF